MLPGAYPHDGRRWNVKIAAEAAALEEGTSFPLEDLNSEGTSPQVAAGDLTSAQPVFYVPTIRNSWGKCKAVRPGPPARSKMILHNSITVQITIFRFSFLLQ